MSKRTHAYIFLLDGGNIFRYQVDADKYEIVPYKNNEKFRPFSNTNVFWNVFWTEWKKYAGYSYKKGDKVDFAFLSDDKDFKFQGYRKKFSLVDSTTLTDKISRFMEKELDYNDLSFEFDGMEEPINKNESGCKKGPKKFYLSIACQSKDEAPEQLCQSEDETLPPKQPSVGWILKKWAESRKKKNRKEAT